METSDSASTEPQQALVIDDEPANRDFLVRLLQQANLQVHGTGTATGALKFAQSTEQLALIVIDNKLPDMDGVELLSHLRERYPSALLVMATMLDDRALMRRAFDLGCDVFLVKPHGFMELFQRWQRLVTSGENTLSNLVIDRHGPRPFRD